MLSSGDLDETARCSTIVNSFALASASETLAHSANDCRDFRGCDFQVRVEYGVAVRPLFPTCCEETDVRQQADGSVRSSADQLRGRVGARCEWDVVSASIRDGMVSDTGAGSGAPGFGGMCVPGQVVKLPAGELQCAVAASRWFSS